MTRQTILLIILVLALMGTGYFVYQNFRSQPEGAINSQTQGEFQNRLAELQRLKELRLDTSIFQDKFFQTLQLPEKPAEQPLTPGRPNPFFPP